MAIEVTIPRLGWSMEEGVFVRWLKQEGDWVAAGDQLFLLESEKATQEIEALDAGVLRLLPTSPQPGATVLVGQVIAVLTAKDEVVEQTESTLPQPATNGTNGLSSSSASASAPPIAGPAARRLARRLNVALDDVAGSGRGGRVTADDIHARAQQQSNAAASASGAGEGGAHPGPSAPGSATSPADGGRVAASPRARRAARNLGVDISQVEATGSTGRVRERDVLAAARVRGEVTAAPAGQQSPGGTPTGPDKIRRTIARRMVASHQSTAPVTLTTKVDATNLVNLRRQFQAAANAAAETLVPSITDLLARLLAVALAEHPRLNARWEEDRVVEVAEIRVGVAVDTEAGLLVPVLGDVRTMGVREIAARSKELVARARAGTLSAADLQGGTITITNLGAFGIDAFTPIINPPEAAILGVGAIRREPVFGADDRIEAREQMTLSLTFDHRVVDGAPAARFLATLRERIENAAAWLAG
ncbi:MAG TPA: dihydrolipoamide acetyltransferase family protein [Pirellulales bacterium]|nr:dihydrolipoamide acetyltransferase family protein [Pirellulales bacterium]